MEISLPGSIEMPPGPPPAHGARTLLWLQTMALGLGSPQSDLR